MKGFIGKLLKINLSNKEIIEEPLNEEIAKNFLGGTGYACRYLYDHLDKDTDPLSPDNILMFMTGPFLGSNIPGSGKFAVCAKSPYTGIWGESNCGGFLAPEIKKAGIDGIIITGASDKPVYLRITENDAEIKDASNLWGKDIFKTSKILKEQAESNLTRVAAIGQAGENLVKYAMIGSEEKAAGRTGMGAVMGSKMLKAITIRGKKKPFEAADPEVLKVAIAKVHQYVKKTSLASVIRYLGTAGGLDIYNVLGELPIKYWTQGSWDNSLNISGSTASEQIHTGSFPCFACPIGCAKRAVIKKGEYKTEREVASPEYETVVSFGSLILNDNLGSIVRANELCNTYGIDTISTGSTIAFVYYLFNNGKITSHDIDGLEPKWGVEKPALEMIKKIAFKEGIGNLLAEGSDAVGKNFGISQDEIATVYGMEVPYHDLRSNFGMAIAYGIGTTRGPCHCSCDMYNILQGIPLEEFGINDMDRYKDDEDMAIASARAQDLRAVTGSMIICGFLYPPPSIIAEITQAVTGLMFTVDDMKIFGERIYMLKHLFNLKMGLTVADDRLPQILLKPLEDGGSAGKSPNFQQLKEAYYKYRTFDPETGMPSAEKLKSLGLDHL
ncbi:MAG: aldehyde ferredoxin oxidoreductase family protein [Promethearchaeota archaeon]